MRIAVANVKGGVGKTTTAVYLSALAARRGPVVLVDADPQASAAEWLEEAPIEGVQLVEAPSERLVSRLYGADVTGTVIVDTPPGSERIVRAAVQAADAVVVPCRVGSLEVNRVMATWAMIPPATRRGLVVCAARTFTVDYRDTVRGWDEAGMQVWGSVPERVAVAAGAAGELSVDALEAYEDVLEQAMGVKA